jgi:hypothetical protein
MWVDIEARSFEVALTYVIDCERWPYEGPLAGIEHDVQCRVGGISALQEVKENVASC